MGQQNISCLNKLQTGEVTCLKIIKKIGDYMERKSACAIYAMTGIAKALH